MKNKNTCDKHYGKHGFCCPNEILAKVKDDLFCTPIKCPEKVPTKRFASPNTQLPPKEFEEQKQCIEQINNLLNTLTNPRDPNNLSALRLHFKTLTGILVEIEVECNNTKEIIKGVLEDAGRDFLQIEDIGKKYFIPYIQICMISSNDCKSSEHHNRELEDIDDCLRREIVLNFGKVVSSDPKLINFFFGIPLYLELVQFIGCQAFVMVEGISDVVKGELVKSIKNKIFIKTSEEDIKEIDITDICNIAI